MKFMCPALCAILKYYSEEVLPVFEQPDLFWMYRFALRVLVVLLGDAQ